MLKAHVVTHLMTEGVVSRSAIAQIELNADESMSDYPRSLRLFDLARATGDRMEEKVVRPIAFFHAAGQKN